MQDEVPNAWQSAEHAAAREMRRLGFRDVSLTAPGADHGIDILAAGAVAQVKHLSIATGRPDLQRLVGAAPMISTTLLFFATAGYTRSAIGYAVERGMALFILSADGRALPASPRAEQLEAAAEVERRRRRAPGQSQPRVRLSDEDLAALEGELGLDPTRPIDMGSLINSTTSSLEAFVGWLVATVVLSIGGVVFVSEYLRTGKGLGWTLLLVVPCVLLYAVGFLTIRRFLLRRAGRGAQP